MKGFIVDETYRIEHGKAYVYLFGRLENGKSFCTITYFRPYIFIEQADVQKAQNIPTTIAYEIEETTLKTMHEKPVAKLTYDIPKDTVSLRKVFEEHKITCYEADIRFTQRFLMDHNILRTLDIDGAYEESVFVDRVYKEPTLTATEWQPTLTTLSFDIETSPTAKYLYSIALVCGETKEVLIVYDRDTPLQHARAFKDEKSLLEYFTQRVVELDPDIITGWNSIDFDLAVIRKKCKEHHVPFKMARWDWECMLRVESSFMKTSTADFPGRQVLDGIQLLKLNFINLDNYKLATAASVLLGEKKLIGENNKGKEIEDAYRKTPQKFVDYNLKDAELVLAILKKTNATDITITRALLTGMNPGRVRGSIASFDSLYLRELRNIGHVAPCVGFSEREERISGGYVMEGKPGMYDYIVVCDFKSLYPSLIRTFNIDPLAHAKTGTTGIKAPNGVYFEDGEGILPGLLQKLWHARDAAKKRNDNIASFAIKILMNSFFGVLASPACRFYSLDIGNAITSFARYFIKMTIEKVEALGYDVIYSDTDSCFINVNTKSYEEAEQIGKEIANTINAFYNEHIQQEYNRKSFLELEPEKIFIHFIMPKVRHSDQGAKKRYAGIILKDGKEELDVTGLEIVRRDWTQLAKKFQAEILQMVFKKKDPSSFIRTFVQELKNGTHDELLVYKKAIRKDLAGYVKTTPPHVKAARLLEEHGQTISSNVIEYVMTESGPYPLQLQPKQIDYEHYTEKQLKPIADGILLFFDTTFDDVLKGSKQMTLGGF